jgi:hypothetical protein
MSHEKKKARRALRRRISEIIRSYTEDEFDVEDVCMREYADDVDIAPIELMIVVRTVIYRFYGPGPPVSCRACHDRHDLLTIYNRTRPTPQGFPLVQTSAAYLTFITLSGSSSCVHGPP